MCCRIACCKKEPRLLSRQEPGPGAADPNGRGVFRFGPRRVGRPRRGGIPEPMPRGWLASAGLWSGSYDATAAWGAVISGSGSDASTTRVVLSHPVFPRIIR